jgi:hypothetical protein
MREMIFVSLTSLSVHVDGAGMERRDMGPHLPSQPSNVSLISWTSPAAVRVPDGRLSGLLRAFQSELSDHKLRMCGNGQQH